MRTDRARASSMNRPARDCSPHSSTAAGGRSLRKRSRGKVEPSQGQVGSTPARRVASFFARARLRATDMILFARGAGVPPASLGT